jgi:hypothetical protein
MSIKKPFVEIHKILLENSDKNISEVLPLLEPLMEAQVRDKAHKYDDDGNLWIFCYYHKEWEQVGEIEYGSKKNTATGYNTMCKVGVNQWTKQQREFKKAKAELLDKVMAGEVDAADLNDEIAALEEKKDEIVPLT